MKRPSESEITALLQAWSAGVPDALARLMPVVTYELRRLARGHLRREAVGHTLQPTALVNELYLRLAGQRRVSWQNRAQFFAFSAQVMRRVLVDHARSRRRAKRGGGQTLLALEHAAGVPSHEQLDVLGLDGALDALTAVDARLARVVELRVFGGLTVEEVAHVLTVGTATVKRDWASGIAWLYRELNRTAIQAGAQR